jgi:hypothetical protein
MGRPPPAVLDLFTEGSKLSMGRHSNILPLEVTLGLQSLRELLGKYYLHGASDRRDRVYALCSMATDSHHTPDIRVNYKQSWRELLQSVTRYMFGHKVSITISGNGDQVIATGLACPLGLIKSADRGVKIQMSSFSGVRGQRFTFSCELKSHRYARRPQRRDIVCMLEGARHPSVIRLCGHHFDVIIPALIIAKDIPVRLNGPSEAFDSEISWDKFSTTIIGFPRYVVLVWDWPPTQQPLIQDHHTLLDHEQSSQYQSYSTQFINAARLLDDVQEQRQLSQLVKSCRRSMLNSAQLQDLKMLTIVLEYWDLYICLKKYMSQLRWSVWALNASVPGSSEAGIQMRRYWQTKGFIDWDLFAIATMVDSTSESLAKIGIAYEVKHCMFDEVKLSPLLHLLFPSCSHLMAATGNGAALITPVSGRYLMRLVLSTVPGDHSSQHEILECMLARNGGFNDSADEAISLLFAILSESDSTSFRITPGILRCIHQRNDFRLIWRTLITEFSGKPEVIFTILRDISLSRDFDNSPYLGTHGDIDAEHLTWTECLSTSNLALQHCVRGTDFCALAVDDWDAGPQDSFSVIQFLCETLNDPPLECPSEQYNQEAFFENENTWRTAWRIWKRDNTRSRDQRIQLARVCLLGVLQARRETDGHPPAAIADEDKVDHATMLNALTLLRGEGVLGNGNSSGVHDLTAASDTDIDMNDNLVD